MNQKTKLQFNKETVEVLDHLESNNVLGGDGFGIGIEDPGLAKTRILCISLDFVWDCGQPGATKSCDGIVCIPSLLTNCG